MDFPEEAEYTEQELQQQIDKFARYLADELEPHLQQLRLIEKSLSNEMKH